MYIDTKQTQISTHGDSLPFPQPVEQTQSHLDYWLQEIISRLCLM